MSVFIKRNSQIPIKTTHTHHTLSDYQTSMRFQIYEGERPLVKDNNLLDEFVLNGITPAPRKETKVDVTFDIDENGILNVLAAEKGTGVYKSITVSDEKGILYKEEIDRLIREAEEYKDDDRKAKERIDSMNRLEDYAYDLRKQLKNKKNTNIYDSFDEIMLNDAIDSTIEWLCNNQDACKEEYEERRRNLRKIASPILHN